MIDLRRLGEDPYRQGILKKGFPLASLEQLVASNQERLRLRSAVEQLRASHNAASKRIGRVGATERQAALEEATRLKKELGELEPELARLEAEVAAAALRVPNPAHESVPEGGEDEGEVLRTQGSPVSAPALDHAELAESLGLVDTKSASKISGSRFAYLRGPAVLLELAMVRWSMDVLVGAGFEPVLPPVLVREQTMEAAGFFPTDRHQVYAACSAAGQAEGPDSEELYLVGTSEVPLAGLHMDSKLSEEELPRRYAGFSTCFRREAGTYGRDTKGIFRVHQFDKVEMFSFAHPERSWEEHEALLAIQESMVSELGMPYRVVNIASRELGAPAAKKYDIEVWLPSEGRYREITSCSNYTDYSARRLKARFRRDGGLELVHTLNGTACAVQRTLVFIFEHYQDGRSLIVPEVLRPYTGFDRIEA